MSEAPKPRNRVTAFGSFLMATSILTIVLTAICSAFIALVILLFGQSLIAAGDLIVRWVQDDASIMWGIIGVILALPVGAAIYGLGCLLPAIRREDAA